MVVCTPTKRIRIVERVKKGQTFEKIAKDLRMDATTVARNYHQMLTNPDPYYRKRSTGHPRALSDRDKRRAAFAIYRNHTYDATDTQRQLFPRVSPMTVRRALTSMGLPGRVRRNTPFLSKIHVLKRKKWGADHADWDLGRWKQVVFSDETKIEIWGSDGRHYCRRRVGEAFRAGKVKRTVKHGGGHIMVWGCISWEGVGRLHQIEGNMTAVKYCSILESSFLPSLSDNDLNHKTIIFQQDNDPKHCARLTRHWFRDHDINLLPWPPSSPDMNIIEHVWKYIKDKIHRRNRHARNADELWAWVQEEWNRMDMEFILKLYRSLPRRLMALNAARGGHTKY